MQIKAIKGDITRGTILAGINTTESGVKSGKAIMDYYLQGKNRYQIFAYLQMGNSDELYTIYDNTIDCQYSKLEDWFKQCLKNCIRDGGLRKLFRTYENTLNNGNTLQSYEIAESILIDITENGYNSAVNWEALNRVFNDCMNKKVQKISLNTSIIVRSSGFESEIGTSLIGSTIGVITFIKKLGLEQAQYYDCEVTYDKLITNIKLKIKESGKQLVVNININHNNRLAERELESFIVSKASSVNFINKEKDIQTPMMNMQLRDALYLDKNMSLSSGMQTTQFSDYYWQNLGRNKQSNLF